MSFTRINGVLHAEQCSLQQLAQQFGTPLYVYSKATFEKHYLDMDRAFGFIDHQICFAVKSNSNIAVLNVLAKLGARSEEHTSELQSRENLVCRLLLVKKK